MQAASHFFLRPFVENDAVSFAEAVRESGATLGKWMSWAHAGYTDSDALSWFSHCTQERANGASHEFGIFDAQSGGFVGGCGLNQFNVANGFCNLGYWVRQSWHRRGAASAAIQALSRVAFSELQLGRVEIVVAVDNIPSLALAAKSGALRECLARNRLKVHGKFTDAYVFSLVPEPKAQSLGEIGAPMPT
jgi:RimJ/RimL family protein N-acetyltransferase